jgi:hypothetical protein
VGRDVVRTTDEHDDSTDGATSGTDPSRAAVLEPAADGSPGRRGFGKLLLTGAAGVAGLSGSAAAECDWREQYDEYVQEHVPLFYEEVAVAPVAEAMIEYEAEHGEFFDALGEEVSLDAAEVTYAAVRPEPCGGPPTTAVEELNEIIDENLLPVPGDPDAPMCPICELGIAVEDQLVYARLGVAGPSSGVRFEEVADGTPVPFPADPDPGRIEESVQLPF